LTRAFQALALRARCARPKSLLRFCRTLEHLLGCYSLSRRAPSTTRPPLHAAARVPEATHAIKSTAPRVLRPWGPSPRYGPEAPPQAAPATPGPSCCWPPYWAAPACSAAERRDRRPWVPGAAAQAPQWE